MIKIEPLCKSEQEVYKLVLKGLSYPEIAKKRGVSISTIKTQLDHIYKKLVVSGRVELMANRIKELENELCRTKYRKID